MATQEKAIRVKSLDSVLKNIELLRFPDTYLPNRARDVVPDRLSLALGRTTFEDHTFRSAFQLKQSMIDDLTGEVTFPSRVIGFVFGVPARERELEDIRTAIVTVPLGTHGSSGIAGINIALTLGELSYPELGNDSSFCLRAAGKAIFGAANGDYDLLADRPIEHTMAN